MGEVHCCGAFRVSMWSMESVRGPAEVSTVAHQCPLASVHSATACTSSGGGAQNCEEVTVTLSAWWREGVRSALLPTQACNSKA